MTEIAAVSARQRVGGVGCWAVNGNGNAISSGDNNSHKNCHRTAANGDRTAVCRVDFLCAARKTTTATATFVVGGVGRPAGN